MTKIYYGNGTSTSYTYDNKNFRLERLSTIDHRLSTIQNLSYNFDNTGNVLSIIDNSDNGTNIQFFEYDDLNRLTKATGESYKTINYKYDSIGNMLQNGDITMEYGKGKTSRGEVNSGGGEGPWDDSSLFNHPVQYYGQAQIDTTQKRFGTGSSRFDGDYDYLSIPDSYDWDVCSSATDDWTIDFWVRHIEHYGDETYIIQFEDGNNWWKVTHTDWGTGPTLKWYAYNGDTFMDTGIGEGISDSDWHHIACIKAGNKYAMYKDGRQLNYTETNNTDNFTGPLAIGAMLNGQYFEGNIDEVRITHYNLFSGSPNAERTSTITLPTQAASSVDENTKLLLHFDTEEQTLPPATYDPNSAGPHAVTSYKIPSTLGQGEGEIFHIAYDANGNMTQKEYEGGIKTYKYDIENRLIEVGIPKEEYIPNYTINLNPGWNIISIPVITTQDIPTILKSSNIPKAQVSRYDSQSQSWKHFVYEEGKDLSLFSDFTTFEYGKGYEIYVDQACTITVSGNTPISARQLTLTAGKWNIVSAPTTTSIDAATAFKGLTYTKVLSYNGTSFVDVTELHSGEGYFLLLDPPSQPLLRNKSPTSASLSHK